MDNWQSLVGMPKLLNTGSKRCKINIITPKIPYTIDPSMCNWPGASIDFFNQCPSVAFFYCFK